MKITQRMKNEPKAMLLTNNSRRMAGLAPHRRGVNGRDKNMEAIGAFIDYCNGEYGKGMVRACVTQSVES